MSKSFNMELSEAGVQEYVLYKAKDIIKETREFYEITCHCDLDSLQIVRIEDGKVELGLANPGIEKSMYVKLAQVAECKYGELFKDAFFELTKQEFDVRIVPVEIEE